MMEALVSPQWVAENQAIRDIVILDATLKKTINASNVTSDEIIPGSVFFDLENTFSNPDSLLPHTFPELSSMPSLLASIGLTQDSVIVVYDQQGVYSAPRVWWMLKVMGIQNVYLLDGGLPAWKAAGLEVSRKYTILSKKSTGHFCGHPNQIVDKTFVSQNIETSHFVLVDARPAARFNGLHAEPRSGLRCGHIPGSVNIPFTEVLIGGKYKSPPSLKCLFAQKGIVSPRKMVFSCGSGVTACIVLLAAYHAGFSDLRIYDGSWAEWGACNETNAVITGV